MTIDYHSAQTQVYQAADRLAAAEKALAEEYLLYVSSGQYKDWQAQKMAEVKHGHAVRMAQAAYEIALETLRRSK